MDRFDIEAELAVGSAGQFDVLVDDKLVYSRFVTGKLPDEELLLESLDL